MPLVAPLYFLFSNWWDVEPKLIRWMIMSVWGVYYVPKGLIAIGLGLRDAWRGAGWIRSKLNTASRSNAEPRAEPTPSPSDHRVRTRREFLREIGWGTASVPFVMVGYSLFRTVEAFQVRNIPLAIENLPRQLEGLTIAQLSDLHAGSFFDDRPAREIVSLVQNLRPDLITITGDYVNSDAAELPLVEEALRQLDAPLGVYGCLGNHDHYADVAQVRGRLEQQTPIHMLVNSHQTFAIDGARLHLIGTDNTGFNQEFGDLQAAVDGMTVSEGGDDVQILLAHVPTFWDTHVRPSHPAIDVMLCGHTHGGQVGIELGPMRWGLARIAYERWAGLYAEPALNHPTRSQQQLYVNRGVGTVGPPLRMGIRPEITAFTLRRA